MTSLSQAPNCYSPGFTLDYDMKDHLIRERWWGIWDQPTLDRYEIEIASLIKHMPVTGDTRRTLLDLRELPVQLQAIADAMQVILTKDNSISKRTAVVMTSAILKLQANRVANSPHRQFFASMERAEEWLLAGEVLNDVSQTDPHR
jgi:hypothetical protein